MSEDFEASFQAPYSREAEMSVLGAILIEPDALGRVNEILRAEDFHQEAHVTIYEGVLDLDAKSITADLVTLAESLKSAGKLDDVGGESYLIKLLDILPSAANVDHYARIVREKSVRRQLMRAAESIRTEALTSDADSAEILDVAEQAVFEIGEREGAQGTVAVGQVLETTFNMIEERLGNRGALTGVDTGYFRLNDMTAGLQKGDLIVLAARPSMGKTTLALNIGLNAALASNARVLLFSLEMSAENIVQNLLCAASGVDGNAVRKGTLSDRDWAKLNDAAGQLHEKHFMIDSTPGLTPMSIRTKARRVAKKLGGVDLIMVDYLQMVAPPPRSENRQQEMAKISRSMKELARELECPLIALSQLNRSVDSREDHRPRLSDLRESGAIEQDADVICFLFRESYYKTDGEDADNPAKPSELIIAKQRNGPTGKVDLVFFPNRLKFENASREAGAF